MCRCEHYHVCGLPIHWVRTSYNWQHQKDVFTSASLREVALTSVANAEYKPTHAFTDVFSCIRRHVLIVHVHRRVCEWTQGVRGVPGCVCERNHTHLRTRLRASAYKSRAQTRLRKHADSFMDTSSPYISAVHTIISYYSPRRTVGGKLAVTLVDRTSTCYFSIPVSSIPFPILRAVSFPPALLSPIHFTAEVDKRKNV